jgi:hypothetical protein
MIKQLGQETSKFDQCRMINLQQQQMWTPSIFNQGVAQQIRPTTFTRLRNNDENSYKPIQLA